MTTHDGTTKVFKYFAGFYIPHFIKKAIKDGYSHIILETGTLVAVVTDEVALGHSMRDAMRKEDTRFPSPHDRFL